jgi:hypothetical protein
MFDGAWPAEVAVPSQPTRSPQGPRETPATVQQVQAASEYADGGVVEGGETYVPLGPALELDQEGNPVVQPGWSWDWYGTEARRTFRIAHSVGLMPLLKFSHAAKTGMDSEDLEGMAALYTMIRDCVHPEDWEAFQEYATLCKADDEDLMDFVSGAMEVISARPRRRRGSSSATSPSMQARSRASSSRQASVIPPGAIVPDQADGLMPVSDLVK